MDFDEKVEQLQAEIAELDKKIYLDSGNAKYFFIGAVCTPFTMAGLLCLISPGFLKTDDKLDRKKVVKWTIIITIVIWLILYLVVKMGLI